MEANARPTHRPIPRTTSPRPSTPPRSTSPSALVSPPFTSLRAPSPSTPPSPASPTPVMASVVESLRDLPLMRPTVKVLLALLLAEPNWQATVDTGVAVGAVDAEAAVVRGYALAAPTLGGAVERMGEGLGVHDRGVSSDLRQQACIRGAREGKGEGGDGRAGSVKGEGGTGDGRERVALAKEGAGALAALELLCTVAEGAAAMRGYALAAPTLAGAVERMGEGLGVRDRGVGGDLQQ